MTILVNGKASEHIPVTDRGLAYGDGVFETILVHQGRPVLLAGHLKRLKFGLHKLSISLEESLLTSEIKKIISDFESACGVLKIIITRGAGGRGYRSNSAQSNRILSLQPYVQPAPDMAGIKAFVCRQRLAEQATLAGLKHLNRLEQVLASLEWPDDTYQEGLMLSTASQVIEGTRSNLFVRIDGRWVTPDLTLCGVNGVLRAHLLECWPGRVEVAALPMADLLNAQEGFFCNSLAGIMPIASITEGNTVHSFTPGPLCQTAVSCFADLLSS